MTKKILVLLANGFEEVEAIATIDVLRRAEADVCIASIHKEKVVTSDRGVQILAEELLENIHHETLKAFDMIALPGGYECAMSFANDSLTQKTIKDFHSRGKFVAAICASPIALYHAAILENTVFTCYPGIETNIKAGHYTEDKSVVVSDTIITANGPASAIAFALTLVEQLFNQQKAQEIAKSMLKTCC